MADEVSGRDLPGVPDIVGKVSNSKDKSSLTDDIDHTSTLRYCAQRRLSDS